MHVLTEHRTSQLPPLHTRAITLSPTETASHPARFAVLLLLPLLVRGTYQNHGHIRAAIRTTSFIQHELFYAKFKTRNI